jgi:hypothetical protein
MNFEDSQDSIRTGVTKMNVRAYSKVKTLLARISLFPLRAHYSVEARISPMPCAHFSVFTRIFPSSCAHFSVVARKIPENFDAHFSFLRASAY